MTAAGVTVLLVLLRKDGALLADAVTAWPDSQAR